MGFVLRGMAGDIALAHEFSKVCLTRRGDGHDGFEFGYGGESHHPSRKPGLAE